MKIEGHQLSTYHVIIIWKKKNNAYSFSSIHVWVVFFNLHHHQHTRRWSHDNLILFSHISISTVQRSQQEKIFTEYINVFQYTFVLFRNKIEKKGILPIGWVRSCLFFHSRARCLLIASYLTRKFAILHLFNIQ